MRETMMAATQSRDSERWFFVWMAGACTLTALAGFAPTYWLRLPAGTFVGSPLLHLHGLLFSAWTVFFLLQTLFAARGRLDRHRSWGLLGISLATAMVFVGLALASQVLQFRLAAGYGDRARAFHVVTTSMMLLFSVLVAAAMATVRRPALHKRLMVLATISVMPPAIARLVTAVTTGVDVGMRPSFAPPRPVDSVLGSALLADAFIVAGMIHDWRTRGRPHPAYLIGGVAIVLVQVLRDPISTTRWWHRTADFLAGFSG